MKRFFIFTLVFMMLLVSGARGEDLLNGILDLLETPTATPSPTATPAPNAFRFRDGIRWGMNPAQVRALENVPMTERSTQNWSVMLTDEKVAVSRFTADLVLCFFRNGF
jgi:hypothetical protein